MRKILVSAIFISLFSLKGYSAESYDMTPYWSLTKGEMKARGNLCNGYYHSNNEYICPNGLYLSKGKSIVSNRNMNVLVYGDVEFKGQNVIGSSAYSINILSKTSYVKGSNQVQLFGNIESHGNVELKNNIDINGFIYSSHGNVYLESAEVAGNVTSLTDGVEIKGTGNVIEGDIWGARDIVLSKVTVKGDVTSAGGQIKTERNSNTIEGDVVARGDVILKQTVVRGAVTSRGGAVKTENSNNQIYGDIEALHDVVLKGTTVVGNIQSRGEEIKLENAGGGNSVYGNLVALHQIGIKNSLVCGQVTSRGSEVKLENSGENQRLGVYAYTNAISAFHKATVKNSSVCGDVSGSSYDFHKAKVYCGVDDPSCNPSQTDGSCPIKTLESVCPDMVPEPEPAQCKLLPIEEFNSNSLSNWSVMGFRESTEPSVVGGKFRLSTNKYNQATASAYNYIFPSENNFMQVEFDHYAHTNTTRPGADGVAIVFSNANVPPATGAFGGPIGYGVKPGIEGFAGGWLAFGIDEYGNFSNEGSYYENDYGRPGRRQQSIAIRGAGYKKTIHYNNQNLEGWFGGYKFVTNNEHVGAIDNYGTNGRNGRDSNERHRYRMTVDSRIDVNGRQNGVWVSIERKINGGNWAFLINSFNVMDGYGQSLSPENFRISVTASTGSYTNIHEIDDFQVCADKYKKLTDGIHHFEFDYSGSGSTCQPSKVTLKACMNERCTQTYPEDAAASEGELEPLTVTLLPSSSNSVANWVNGEQEKLTNITFNNSVDLLLQGYKAGTVTMGVANSSVPQFGFEGARCRINNGDELSVENCNVLFSQNVLGVNIGDVVSARQSAGTDHLSFCSSHVKAGGESRDVTMKVTHEIAPVDKTKSVEVWYKKAGDSNAKWSGHAVLQPQVAKSLSDVYFDSNGKAYLKVNYKEVGKIRIDAKVNDVRDSAGFASFVSFPAKLGLSVSDNGECSPSCISYIPAGQEFTMQVTAYQSDGEVARNYQESNIRIDHAVTYPDPTTSVNKGNVVNGTLLAEELPEDAKWRSGSVSFKQSVDEVGAFEFTATAPVGGEGEAFSTYLGSSTYKIADATLNVGRFYPGKFNVYSNDQTPSYNNVWNYPNGQAFAYMGQPFGLKQFYVEALSKGDGALRNYAYFDAQHQAKFNLYENNSATVSRFSAPSTYTGSWLNDAKEAHISGQSVGKYSASGLVWSKVVSKPDGPFNYLENSSDTSISIDLSSSSVDKTGVTIGTKELFVQPDLRFGRVNLADVGGKQGENNKPDSLKLQVPLTVEYWKGGRFVTNSSDSQTTIYGEREKFEHKWKGNEPDSKYVDVSLADGGVVTNGTSRSIVAVEKESNRQQTELWLNLTAGSNNFPWLKYDWDNDGSEENPSTIVTFGINRGDDRVIYRGEPGLAGQ